MGAPPGMQQLRRTCSSTGEGLRPALLWLPPRTVEPQACSLAPLQKIGKGCSIFSSAADPSGTSVQAEQEVYKNVTVSLATQLAHAQG